MLNSIAITLRGLLKNYVYKSRHGLAKGLMRKGGLGFIPEIFIPLTKEEKFLQSLDLNGATVYDIGGYEGVFAMFFAKAVGETGKVFTFEPSVDNQKKIMENIKLNNFKNIEIKPIGLGKKRETLTMAFSDYEMGKGSMNEDIKKKLLKQRGAKTVQVEVYALDDYIQVNSLPKPDFVKIDVEGMELDVLIGMKETIEKYKPKLFIEIHGSDKNKKIKNVTKVVEYLEKKNYYIFHVESAIKINKSNAQKAMIGRLYCS